MKDLANVTGVGPGTGSAIVKKFHDAGYSVAMVARNADRLADCRMDWNTLFLSVVMFPILTL